MTDSPAQESVFSKETDGFFARHFDRKISGAISRRLLPMSITPNQVTIAVTLLGMGAGLFMAQKGYLWKVMGAFLFLVTSILDGCDGEIARAKKMTSVVGGWLDLWGDNIVHVAVFYGLGWGLYKDTGYETYLLLGKWATFGTLLSASVASYQTYRTRLRSPHTSVSSTSLFTSVAGDSSRGNGSLWKKRLIQGSDLLARRDFVYGVVILALFAHLEWFLWACAVGVNVYAVILLLLLCAT